MIKNIRKTLLAVSILLVLQTAMAQEKLASEAVLKQVSRLTTQLPFTIQQAYEQEKDMKLLLDSLEKTIADAFIALAAKANRRSARLNGMININEPDAKFSLQPPNQKMTSYFIAEWDRMDALEKTFNQKVKTIENLKALYKEKGYLPVWDSAYTSRRPALLAYRDGVLKLVQAEIAYLRANEKMFLSKNEDERLQWVETELSVLQKLILLKEKYKKVIVQDGIEKVAFCQTNPEACQK